MKLIINKLEKESIDENHSCLKSLIHREGLDDFILKFEYNVNEKYVEENVVDSFLTSVLPYAMEFGYDTIETINPITSNLYYSLTVNIIPVLSKYEKHFKNVNLKIGGGVCEYINDIKPISIATGCSCGVDSLYTILTNINSNDNYIPNDLNLTDLVVMNTGACSWKGGNESRKWFNIEVDRARQVAIELNLGLITINTNLMEFYGVSHMHSNFMRMIGTLLGIRKLIKRYYFASTYEMNRFGFRNDEDGWYQYFITSELSNKENHFLTSGLCQSRFDKVKIIKNYDVTKKYINVCWTGGNNCGKCEKCLRTLGALDALNVLDDYYEVFDINQYKKERKKNIAKMFVYHKMHPDFYDFLFDIRKNDKRIYNKARRYYLFKLRPYEILKNVGKKIIKKDSWLYKKLKK